VGFDEEDRSFAEGIKSFNEGDSVFAGGIRSFNEEDRSFAEGIKSFNEGGSVFAEGAKKTARERVRLAGDFSAPRANRALRSNCLRAISDRLGPVSD
jgi:hypothetical protein